MTREIERKFLVRGEQWRSLSDEGCFVRQGYLATGANSSVRVRVAGRGAWICVKGATVGVSRPEFEYRVPLADAEEMLGRLCEGPLIEKTRYRVSVGDHVWEIDVFHGDNAGLVVAEVELGGDDEHFLRPDWIGEEVSHDPRYYNACLSRHPYREWS